MSTSTSNDYRLCYLYADNSPRHIKETFLTFKEAWTRLFSQPLGDVISPLFPQKADKATIQLAIYHGKFPRPLLLVFAVRGNENRLYAIANPLLGTVEHDFGGGLLDVMPALAGKAPVLLQTSNAQYGHQPQAAYLRLQAAALEAEKNSSPLLTQLPVQVIYALQPGIRTQKGSLEEVHYFPTVGQGLTAMLTTPVSLLSAHLTPGADSVEAVSVRLQHLPEHIQVARLENVDGRALLNCALSLKQTADQSGIALGVLPGYDPKAKVLFLGASEGVGRSCIPPAEMLADLSVALGRSMGSSWAHRVSPVNYQVSFPQMLQARAMPPVEKWVRTHELDATTALQRLLGTDLNSLGRFGIASEGMAFLAPKDGQRKAYLSVQPSDADRMQGTIRTRYKLRIENDFIKELPDYIQKIFSDNNLHLADDKDGRLLWTANALALRSQLHEHNLRVHKIRTASLPKVLWFFSDTKGRYMVEVVRELPPYRQDTPSPMAVKTHAFVGRFKDAIDSLCYIPAQWFKQSAIDDRGNWCACVGISLYGPGRTDPIASVIPTRQASNQIWIREPALTAWEKRHLAELKKCQPPDFFISVNHLAHFEETAKRRTGQGFRNSRRPDSGGPGHRRKKS